MTHKVFSQRRITSGESLEARKPYAPGRPPATPWLSYTSARISKNSHSNRANDLYGSSAPQHRTTTLIWRVQFSDAKHDRISVTPHDFLSEYVRVPHCAHSEADVHIYHALLRISAAEQNELQRSSGPMLTESLCPREMRQHSFA